VRIIIVGAGIGGRAAALSLRAAGFHPDMLNARPSLTPEHTR